MSKPNEESLVKNTIRDDGVAVIELDRPKKRNALSQVMINQITSTLMALDLNPTVRAVVLTGSGSGPFCGKIFVWKLPKIPLT